MHKEQIEKWAFAEFTDKEVCKLSNDFASFIENIKSGNEQELARLFNNVLTEIEPRQRYVLCQRLNSNGFGHICRDKDDEVYGVVFQVGLESGKETLSVYPNREGWYINYTGKAIKLNPLSEEQDEMKINLVIDSLFDLVVKVAPHFDALNYEHISVIDTGKLRINFLTGKGLRFTEGAMKEIGEGSPAKMIFGLGSIILRKLVDMSMKK